MKREDFVNTFLEGASLATQGVNTYELVGMLFDERKVKYEFAEQIAFMNDIVRDRGWTMNCKRCGESYQPDCELSEMFGAENYCGKDQWCCP